GTFVLWSSMFICTLPTPMSHSAHVGMSTVTHADCFDGKSPTFCKSDARLGLLNLHLFALLDSDLPFRFAAFWSPKTSAAFPIAVPHITRLDIFLVFCSFLK
ncbi:MAG TPA: hypothetical protein VJ998_02335, partial [Pseudomonadales bacterium]|nr:hypothetical protein [Pseudomonadales bacterium]